MKTTDERKTTELECCCRNLSRYPYEPFGFGVNVVFKRNLPAWNLLNAVSSIRPTRTKLVGSQKIISVLFYLSSTNFFGRDHISDKNLCLLRRNLCAGQLSAHKVIS